MCQTPVSPNSFIGVGFILFLFPFWKIEAQRGQTIHMLPESHVYLIPA